MDCQQITEKINQIKILSDRVTFAIQKEQKSQTGVDAKTEIENIIYSKEFDECESLKADLRTAERLMGEDFFGPKQTEEAFRGKLEINDVSPIQFSRAELRRAKKLGRMLIYHWPITKDNEPLTMKKIKDILDNKTKNGQKIIWGDGWFENEKFFTEEKIRPGWALVGKNIIPGSEEKDYFGQTERMVQYIHEELYKDLPIPNEIAWQIKHYYNSIEGIEKLVNSKKGRGLSSRKTGVYQLTNETINKHYRRSAVEALYDWIVRSRGGDIDEDVHEWTISLASSGESIIDFHFHRFGFATVGRWGPGAKLKEVGVCFSDIRK